MRKNKKKIITIFLIILSIILIGVNAYAHSGRTDSNGGHRDNKNKSGLGSYHYHCGGHPAHLHTNGVCPYDASSSSIENSASSSSASSTKTTSTIPTTINVENNSTVKPSIIDPNNIISNTTSSEENNSSLGGMLALGLLGGGGYLGYKKIKK